MVKVQIYVGGCGKVGGVKFCKIIDDVKVVVVKMFGIKMVIYQIVGVELLVNLVLVIIVGEIVKELYLLVLVDCGIKIIIYIVLLEGGVEIEQVVVEILELIYLFNVDFVEGVQGYYGCDFGFKLGLIVKQVGQFVNIMVNLYCLFNEKDLVLVEINLLVILDDGNLYVLDGKFDSDDNVVFCQKVLVVMCDKIQEDLIEVIVLELDINYVMMDGNIGCMVNGVGLVMVMMDVIKFNGGELVNFLDVGGGVNKQCVIEVFKLILFLDKVEGIFVNIFGGIVCCDMIVEGIIVVVKEVGVKVLVVVCLEGINVEEGK